MARATRPSTLSGATTITEYDAHLEPVLDRESHLLHGGPEPLEGLICTSQCCHKLLWHLRAIRPSLRQERRHPGHDERRICRPFHSTLGHGLKEVTAGVEEAELPEAALLLAACTDMDARGKTTVPWLWHPSSEIPERPAFQRRDRSLNLKMTVH